MNFLLIKALLPGAHSLPERGDNDPQQRWVHTLSLASALASAALRSEQSQWKPLVVRDSSTMPELPAQCHKPSPGSAGLLQSSIFPQDKQKLLVPLTWNASLRPLSPNNLAFSSQKVDTKPVPSIPLSPNTDQLYVHVHSSGELHGSIPQMCRLKTAS